MRNGGKKHSLFLFIQNQLQPLSAIQQLMIPEMLTQHPKRQAEAKEIGINAFKM